MSIYQFITGMAAAVSVADIVIIILLALVLIRMKKGGA